jgi:hypothetical protein
MGRESVLKEHTAHGFFFGSSPEIITTIGSGCPGSHSMTTNQIEKSMLHQETCFNYSPLGRSKAAAYVLNSEIKMSSTHSISKTWHSNQKKPALRPFIKVWPKCSVIINKHNLRASWKFKNILYSQVCQVQGILGLLFTLSWAAANEGNKVNFYFLRVSSP